jgi:carbamoyltransferase
MKDMLNSAIKYREPFRPFAPSVLSEHVTDWFNIKKSQIVPYMEQVYEVKKDKISFIPATVHADGTGRLQSVVKELNPLFYKLISEFYKITNIPMVINTSFNVKGEPIVCTPNDAIRTFFSSGLDFLLISDFVVTKGKI